jgi:spore germination cell wall hydrolase CwlJ-like protein|nr:cell wall hydrolase [Oricola indica]
MIRLLSAERKFARTVRLSVLAVILAATSVASMPLYKPPLPDPRVAFLLRHELFLSPHALESKDPVMPLAVPPVAYLNPPIIDTTPAVPKSELACLATAIYFEARGEPERGQKAVAQVILNRVASKAYPKTICGVVYQNAKRRNACQFSFACDGRPDIAKEKKAWSRAKSIASDIVKGRGTPGATLSATHYHADYVSPRWARKMKRLSKIGNHIFYRG